jgi:hypothetical protein
MRVRDVMGIYDRHLRAKNIYSPLWSLGGPFALSLAGLVAIISPNLVAAADAPNQKAPLVLKEQGSFYVGGRIVTSAAISGAGTTPFRVISPLITYTSSIKYLKRRNIVIP